MYGLNILNFEFKVLLEQNQKFVQNGNHILLAVLRRIVGNEGGVHFPSLTPAKHIEQLAAVSGTNSLQTSRADSDVAGLNMTNKMQYEN